jgi:5-methylcytosine-specific restriction enzyme subunit McrC
MPDGAVSPATVATDLVEEQQLYGEDLIRLSEFSSSDALTADQLEVLSESSAQLTSLGLELLPQLDGSIHLGAGGEVGLARFTLNRRSLIVQVEPKIDEVDVFRMLDHVYGVGVTSDGSVEIASGPGRPAVLFLRFFVSQIHSFLVRSRYRGYRFEESSRSGRAKGRPLLRKYVENHLSRADPQTLPCRYLDYSANVFENQVLAYSLQLATSLIDILEGATRKKLLDDIRECTRMLAGVDVNRIDPLDLDRHRYSRLTEDFRPIHRLCRVIIANYQTSFAAGTRVPFCAFAVNMGELFEQYVVRAFTDAFPGRMVNAKPELTYDVNPFAKVIELDGLLEHEGNRTVLECKYKDISSSDKSNDREFVGGKVKSADLYQTIAYASHREVSATRAILAYPAWSSSEGPVEISKATTEFGWYAGATRAVPCQLLGVNLAADYASLVAGIRDIVASGEDPSGRDGSS